MAIDDPTDLTNLQIWCDAQTLGLSDNDAVTSFTDLTGNGHHFTDLSGTKPAPTFKINIHNGHPVVRFDGTDDILYTDAVTFSQPFTFGLFVRQSSQTAAFAFESYISGLSANPSISAQNLGTFCWGYYAGTTDISSSVTQDTNFHSIIVKFDGASSFIRVDGTETTGNGGAGGFSSENISLGARLDGSNNGALYADVDVGEVVFCSAALSSTEITDLEAYFTAHWAAAAAGIGRGHLESLKLARKQRWI